MRSIALTALVAALAWTVAGCSSSATPPPAQADAAAQQSTAAYDLARQLVAAGFRCDRSEPDGDGVLDAAQCELLGAHFYITAYADHAAARAAAERLYDKRRRDSKTPYLLTQDTWVVDASQDRNNGVGILRMFPGATEIAP
ncbi:hypothetical protein ETD86_11555 [Nonomuraea turkmeniaca]|uniref:Lipoprotein n=1 Tax=Nonomuraea turkmeniaca TaxID=103838 RepID=A0A5S4FP67_9ACTN|nr:hypothetical protein [Nonomuraea turkmeniaca]TMR22476.1 hypothetical protein ETD86_11555 [Nonomuraea turkmeniaca]